ncbi:hypothetical protein [uncultured Campylobacter sp.]|uniref:hypothetical protein n=1 Tax=uncultured Campylobacter sp. TaxID=218934 RepID=UPI00262F55FF|nr:hypothetical protein [uncultured Campylobacter sp.]
MIFIPPHYVACRAKFYLGGDISSADGSARHAGRSDCQSLNPLKFKIPSPLELNFKPRARLRRVQGEHKYARRPNGAWTRRSAPRPIAPINFEYGGDPAAMHRDMLLQISH